MLEGLSSIQNKEYGKYVFLHILQNKEESHKKCHNILYQYIYSSTAIRTECKLAISYLQ
jgi:hypothetical protein